MDNTNKNRLFYLFLKEISRKICHPILLGGGIVEMLCAFCGAGIGNFVRCKLTKHHFTLFLGITASVCSASVVYAVLLKAAEVLFAVSAQHEAGYIC